MLTEEKAESSGWLAGFPRVSSTDAGLGEFSVRSTDVEVLEYIKALISSHRS